MLVKCKSCKRLRECDDAWNFVVFYPPDSCSVYEENVCEDRGQFYAMRRNITCLEDEWEDLRKELAKAKEENEQVVSVVDVLRKEYDDLNKRAYREFTALHQAYVALLAVIFRDDGQTYAKIGDNTKAGIEARRVVLGLWESKMHKGGTCPCAYTYREGGVLE